MLKRIISALCVTVIAVSFTACQKIDGGNTGSTDSKAASQKVTRIYNSFADVLPSFDFDGEKTENYKEGISYSFSAKCSDSKFKKYIDKVNKAGFDQKPSEGKGYYAAYSEDGYYTEITLVNGNITVFIKRK
ncbi:MAG: hypothetical protein IKU08_05345 [Clostridia bacterium]|nr:hypothetical protein [Clostridia bacterium]